MQDVNMYLDYIRQKDYNQINKDKYDRRGPNANIKTNLRDGRTNFMFIFI